MFRTSFLIIVLACVLAGGVALAAGNSNSDLASDERMAPFTGSTPARADGLCPGGVGGIQDRDSSDWNYSPLWGDDESDDEGDDEDGDGEYCICHVPAGNPDGAHTICVGLPALCAHLAHGDTLGPCTETCGGEDGDTCDDGQLCKRPEGECADDAEGVCIDPPALCPGVYRPVCGCDGTTYSNECYADVAGVTVEHPGVCDATLACGGAAGDTCDDDQYCRLSPGECADDAEGECADKPHSCPSVYAPVCGCDGVTYDNRCRAASAGVNVASMGECDSETACGGTAGDTCGDDQFCNRPEGECADDAEGVCMDRPQVCPPILDPVCGCDGVTYENACVAHGAGVTISAQGECDQGALTCGGTAGDTCTEDQYCELPEGECSEDAEGTCAPKPMNCLSVFEPVCGCDDVTYDNACFAASAGVNVASEGVCGLEPQSCGGTSGESCEDDQFCKREPGVCEMDAVGTCAPIPLLCPMLQAPVCGCDGMTYQNACFADSASVTVSHDGGCEQPAKPSRRPARGWRR